MSPEVSEILDPERRGDIVEHIRRDHLTLSQMLESFDTVQRDQWGELFSSFVRTIVTHEIAEEEIVYPVIRKQSETAAEVADACITEQSAAEERLDKMEKIDPLSAEFLDELRLLKTDVLAHASHEERDVLPYLAKLAPDDRQMLADRYERARMIAPTHPHPKAPDKPPGNLLLGPVAAVADRVRDAIRGQKAS